MAYTKYSLTPADNNAAAPNGAPEGMLPSGVNDTMRDMMAQIRDVGDGIRGGTYTMTAPVITGGSITGATLGAASPAFTGTPTAPTATAGTNTTQIATTAFVAAALAALYPVGSIYTNAAVSTNPATLLGFGTWTAFGAGRVLVGLDAGDALFDTAEETGGSKDAVVVSHTHTSDQDGHSHFIAGGSQSAVLDNSNVLSRIGNVATGLLPNENFEYSLLGGGTSATIGLTNTVDPAITVSTTGSSGTNANIQPYITVYMWKRTV
jgi:hypothetical protein